MENCNDQQQFLSLMDTIHDFGDTGRTAEVIMSKVDNENTTFNNAVLLDFLMLAFIRDKFRNLIGLSKKQNYLQKKDDCSTDKVNNNDIAQYMCETFYWPTYEKKVVFRSPTEPEYISKAFLFASKNYPRDKKHNTIDGPLENTIPFETSINLYTNTYNTLDALHINQIQKTFQDILGPSQTTRNVLDETKKYTLGPSKIARYILDGNALNNDIFNGLTENGLFTEYDAIKSKAKSKGKNTKGNGNSMTYLAELPIDDDVEQSPESFSFYTSEYFLTKCSNQENIGGELLFLDKIGAYQPLNRRHNLYFMYKNITYSIDVDQSSQNVSNGLGLFVQLINAINERTLGVSSLRQDVKDELKSKLEKLGLSLIRKRYSLILDFQDNTNANANAVHKLDLGKKKQTKDQNFLYLERQDFIIALFDFKRAMDYLYVKACYEANKSQTDTTYVFVSSDRSAIWYALNLGCPCIQTRKAGLDKNGKKQQKVIIYRPDLYKSRPKISSQDMKLLLKYLDEEEKTYELRDDIKLQIKQLEVNKEIIEKELEEPGTSEDQNELGKTLKGIEQKIPELKQLKHGLKKRKETFDKVKKDIEKQVQQQRKAVEVLSPFRSAAVAFPAKIQIKVKKTEQAKVQNAQNANAAICNNKPDYLNDDLIIKKMTKTTCKNWLAKLAEYNVGPSSQNSVPPIPSLFEKSLNRSLKDKDERKRAAVQFVKKWEPYCTQVAAKGSQQMGGLYPYKPPQDKSFDGNSVNIDPKGDLDNNDYINTILDTEIPLSFQDDSDTVFGDLLNAYSILSPTIPYFWYIVFKFICFHIEE